MNPRILQRGYKQQNLDYQNWNQRDHAQDWLLFPDHIGSLLAIDELRLSQGELYTFVTNKKANGKKGSLVDCIRGTKTKTIAKVLNRLLPEERSKVKGVSMDMAKNMESAVCSCFPNASLVTYQFRLAVLRITSWHWLIYSYNSFVRNYRKRP